MISIRVGRVRVLDPKTEYRVGRVSGSRVPSRVFEYRVFDGRVSSTRITRSFFKINFFQLKFPKNTNPMLKKQIFNEISTRIINLLAPFEELATDKVSEQCSHKFIIQQQREVG